MLRRLPAAILIAFVLAFCLAARPKPPTPTPTPPSAATLTEYTGNYSSTTGHCILLNGVDHFWVHDAVIGPCNGDGIKALNSSHGIIGPNVHIVAADSSVSAFGSDHIVINGLVSDNPYRNHVRINGSTDIDVLGGVFTENVAGYLEDGVNVYGSSDVLVAGVMIVGGDSPTGCGVIQDAGSSDVTVIGTHTSGEANCGIAVSSGSGFIAASNNVETTSIVGAWEMFARNFDGGCDDPMFVGNTASFFYDGGDCGTVLESGNSW